MAEIPKTIYELVHVPGYSDLQILAVSRSVSPYHFYESGSKSPWWMISMKAKAELLSSSVDGKDGDITFAKCAELYGFQVDVSRRTEQTVSSQLFTSARIQHDDCIVLIPNGGYIADIETNMTNNTVLPLIHIVCVGWFEGKLQVYQKIKFEHSRVTQVIPDLDRVFVRFRVLKKTYTFIPFDQETSKKGGQAVCTIDISKNTHK